MRTMVHSVLLVLAGLTAGMAGQAQSTILEDKDLSAAANRLKAHTGDFDGRLREAVGKSRWRDSVMAQRLNSWAEVMEREISGMAGEWKDKDQAGVLRHLDLALAAAAALNRLMLSGSFEELHEGQWKAIRDDFNQIAGRFARPILPDTKVVVITPWSKETLERPEVAGVMERLEPAADRFKDKFGRSSPERTIHGQAEVRDWMLTLESTSDEVLNRYKAGDVNRYQAGFESMLMAAAAMNAWMLANRTAEGGEEWSKLREEINSLASAFGYARLPDSTGSVGGSKATGQ